MAGDWLRGIKGGENGSLARAEDVGCRMPATSRTRHPNHIVANASTYFIAGMRALSTQDSQEEENMIGVKLHLRGGKHMITGGQIC